MDEIKYEKNQKIQAEVKLRKRKGPTITTVKKGEEQLIGDEAKPGATSDHDESNKHPDETVVNKGKKSFGKRVSFPGKADSFTSLHEERRAEPKTTTVPVKKWIPADTGESHDIRFLVMSMRDFTIYVIYLFLVMVVAFGERGDAFNYYAQVLSDLILGTEFEVVVTGNTVTSTFRHMENPKHFWAFVESVLFNIFYGASGDETGPIMQETILIGVPQMKQKRIKPGTCQTPPIFDDVYKSCYGYYSTENEQKSSYRMKNSTPWQYSEEDSSFEYVGTLGSYSSGGYIFNFSTDPTFSKLWISELQRNNWIDRSTRAVFVDFTLYCQNLRLYCVAELVFEFTPSGNVISNSEFSTMKFMRYNLPWDYFIMSCEFTFVILTVYFALEIVKQLYLLRLNYFHDGWNVVDVVIISIALIIAVFGIKKVVYSKINASKRLSHIRTQHHDDFEEVVYHQTNFNTFVSILVFCAWLKLMKYSALNKSVYVILSALSYVKIELITLTAITAFVSTGFSILGVTLFGTHVKQFYTMSDSFFTLNGFYAGGLYFYEDCVRSSPTMAPIYFCIYVFLVVVFILNGFLALIVHGIHLSFEDEEDSLDRKYFNDLAREALIRLLVRMKLYRLMKSFRAREMIDDYKQEYDAFVRVLEKHGCRGADLQLVLLKYKIKKGSRLDFNLMKEAYEDVCARNQLHLEVEEHSKIMTEVERIERLVESCDQTILDLMTKVEILSDKITKTPAPLKGLLKK